MKYEMIPGSAEWDGDIFTIGTMAQGYTKMKYLRGNLVQIMHQYKTGVTVAEVIQGEREKIDAGLASNFEVVMG